MARELLAPGTGAAVSDPVSIPPNETATVEFIGQPGASDSIFIQYTPNGADWYNLKEGGVERALDFANNVQRVTGPVKIRVDRVSTTATVGAALATRSSP